MTDKFAGFGDPCQPLKFDFDFKFAKKVEQPALVIGDVEVYRSKAAKTVLDPMAGLGDPTTGEEDGTFTKAALRFKAGDRVRVKSRGGKIATLTYINRAMGRQYSLAAFYPDGDQIVGVFPENDVEAA